MPPSLREGRRLTDGEGCAQRRSYLSCVYLFPANFWLECLADLVSSGPVAQPIEAEHWKDYGFLYNPFMKCVVCSNKLSGRQRKFCSRTCKNRFGNNAHQSYLAQQNRGRKRKIELVLEFGRQCSKCGYKKNFAALEFHHVDPETKSFQLDLRCLSNRTWSSILEEGEKCVLLCSNCHAELHNPECVLKQRRQTWPLGRIFLPKITCSTSWIWVITC